LGELGEIVSGVLLGRARKVSSIDSVNRVVELDVIIKGSSVFGIVGDKLKGLTDETTGAIGCSTKGLSLLTNLPTVEVTSLLI
jgi:hypothetical protein